MSDFTPPPAPPPLPPPPPPRGGAQVPSPAPPSGPPPGKRPVVWMIAAIVAISVVATGAFLFTRKGSGTSGSRTGAGASRGPAVGAAPGELTGTVTYRGACAGILFMRVTDLGSTPLSRTKMAQEASGAECKATFATALSHQGGIQLFLEAEQGSGGHPTTLTGPRYTPEQLMADNYKLALTLDDFGVNASQQAATADLSVAIRAAATFYKSHGTFVGLTPAYLEKQAPQLTFNTSDQAVKGEVTLRETTPTTVLFVALRDDGTPIATGFKPPRLECYGETDARTFGQCLAWQPPGGAVPGEPGATPGKDAPVSL